MTIVFDVLAEYLVNLLNLPSTVSRCAYISLDIL